MSYSTWPAIARRSTKRKRPNPQKALTGEITSNAQMVEALEDLNREYLDEAADFEDFTSDLNPCTITYYENAEERGEGVIEATYAILRMFGFIDNLTNRFVYKNEKGQICDENGILLSKDLEHRVFEVIKGGKQDN